MTKRCFFVTSVCILLMICGSACELFNSSSPETVLVAPKIPIKDAVSDTTISIRWTEVDNANGYDVYISTSANSGSSKKKNTSAITDTSYTLTDLNANTTYFIWLKAKNSEDDSAFSPLLMVQTNKTPTVEPNPPKIPIKDAVSDTTISIRWTEVDNANGYDVYIGTSANSGSSKKKNTSAITGLSHTLRDLTTDTTYYIWLKAKNSKGDSTFSPPLTVKTDATGGNTDPDKHKWSATTEYTTGKAVIHNNKYYKAKWWTKATAPSTSSDSHPWQEITKEEFLQIVNESDPDKPTVEPAPPQIPIEDDVSDTTISIRWTEVDNANGYDVYIGTSTNSSASEKKGSNITGTTYTLTGLKADTTYYIWLKAKNSKGDSTFSPPLTVKTSKASAIEPAPPQIPIEDDVSDTTISIRWTEVDNANGYDVYIGTSTNSDSSKKKNTSAITGTTYTLTGLKADTTYYIWLKAKNADVDSAFSPPLTVKTSKTTSNPNPDTPPTYEKTVQQGFIQEWHWDDADLPAGIREAFNAQAVVEGDIFAVSNGQEALDLFASQINAAKWEELFPRRINSEEWQSNASAVGKPRIDYYSFENFSEAMLIIGEYAYMRDIALTSSGNETSSERNYVLHKPTKKIRLISQSDGYFTANSSLQTSDHIKKVVDYAAFGREGSDNDKKRVVAGFLAHASHETSASWSTAPGHAFNKNLFTGATFPDYITTMLPGELAWSLFFNEEVAHAGATSSPYTDPNNKIFPPTAGQSYHGRGAFQLSWNYNYGLAAAIFFGDSNVLLDNANFILTGGIVPNNTSGTGTWRAGEDIKGGTMAFLTSLMFWLTPQSPKPSQQDTMILNRADGRYVSGTAKIDAVSGRGVPGYGWTINIMNGGYEAGVSWEGSGDMASKVARRVKHYLFFTQALGGNNTGEVLDARNSSSY